MKTYEVELKPGRIGASQYMNLRDWTHFTDAHNAGDAKRTAAHRWRKETGNWFVSIRDVMNTCTAKVYWSKWASVPVCRR